MDRYYYMISQLPVLYFNKELIMTIDAFLGEAEKWLTANDYKILSNVNINDTNFDIKGARLLREYRKFEFQLRNELALWRKSVKEGEEYKPKSFAVSLLKEGNPLEIEKKLLKHRWNFIEEKEVEHHFDLEFLILYFLKLQILLRLSLFDNEKGLQIFQKIVEDTSINHQEITDDGQLEL